MENISIRRYLQQSHADALSDGTHLFTASPGGSPTDAAFAYGAFIIQCRDNSNTGFAVRIGNGSGVGTAFRINSAKNAFFTGTISSGAITSSGLVTADELSVTNDATFNGAIDASGQTITSGAITSTGLVKIDYTNPTLSFRPDNSTHFNIKANESAARLELGHSNNKNLYLSNTGNATFNYDLTVSGNLTVNGTTTTLNTATLDVEDKNITLNYSTGDSSAAANGAGFTIQDAVSAGNDATLLWDATYDRFAFSHGIKLPDSQKLLLGDGSDFQLEHNSAGDSVINNLTGDLYITNKADDKDIIFRTDDGSGGFTTYMQFDGSDTRILTTKDMRFSDSAKALFGFSNDLQIYHDATNSVIWNQTGHLTIQILLTIKT